MTSDTGNIRSKINALLVRLKQSSFLKNILIVMGGTAIAQGVAYALSPIISRLFTPDDFGIFGSFIAVAGIIGSLITLDYSQASMLPKEKCDALNLFCLSIASVILITLFIILISVLTPSIFFSLTKTKGFWPLFLFFLTLLITGINNALQAWAVRSKAFKRTSLSQVIRSIGSGSARIIFGIFKAGSFGLIISNILADLLVSINLIQVATPDLKSMRNAINFKKLKILAKEYIDFPLYSASQNFVNAISSGLPILLITRFYGLAAAGSYAFSMSIIQAPMSLVLTALRQVLFQKACEFHHEGKGIFLLYIRTVIILFTIAFIPSLILLFWSPMIFTFIFGVRWQLAGILARSLIVWMIFAFCNLPAVIFSRIIRIQRYVFFYDIMLLLLRTASLILGGMYLKLTQTVMVFAIVGAIMNLFLICYVGRKVGKKEGIINLLAIDNLFD